MSTQIPITYQLLKKVGGAFRAVEDEPVDEDHLAIQAALLAVDADKKVDQDFDPTTQCSIIHSHVSALEFPTVGGHEVALAEEFHERWDPVYGIWATVTSGGGVKYPVPSTGTSPDVATLFLSVETDG